MCDTLKFFSQDLSLVQILILDCKNMILVRSDGMEAADLSQVFRRAMPHISNSNARWNQPTRNSSAELPVATWPGCTPEQHCVHTLSSITHSIALQHTILLSFDLAVSYNWSGTESLQVSVPVSLHVLLSHLTPPCFHHCSSPSSSGLPWVASVLL